MVDAQQFVGCLAVTVYVSAMLSTRARATVDLDIVAACDEDGRIAALDEALCSDRFRVAITRIFRSLATRPDEGVLETRRVLKVERVAKSAAASTSGMIERAY